jgi:hypothetical protein
LAFKQKIFFVRLTHTKVAHALHFFVQRKRMTRLNVTLMAMHKFFIIKLNFFLPFSVEIKFTASTAQKLSIFLLEQFVPLNNSISHEM